MPELLNTKVEKDPYLQRNIDVLILYTFEFFDSIEEAIHREKRLKKYPRAWKENLINKRNPQKEDLFDKIGNMR